MSGFSVAVTQNKGRGLFATKEFDVGDVILSETPLISSQFSWNNAYQYLACEYCLRPLETAESNAQRLANDKSITLPYPQCCITVPWLEKHTKCSICGTKYCSEECRAEASQKYHSFICTLDHSTPGSQPISELVEVWKKMHYPPETASIMLIVKIMAMFKQVPEKEEFLKALNDFQHITSNEELQIFHKLFGEKFTEQLEELYKEMVKVFPDEDLKHWMTPEGFKTLFVLIGTNGQGIGTTSVGEWSKNVGNLENLSDDEKKSIELAIDDLYMKMDDFSGQFLNVEGSGLYIQQSKINHSCAPNCEVQFPLSNHMLQVTALQKINVGEEICISYLDECALTRSRHSRQKVLRENYLFVCQCEKCNAEINEPDKTSSEEEEDDEGDDEEMQED